MAWSVVRFETTPNPNAMKCIVDGPLADPPRPYRHAADADADPIARSLFAIEGVTGVLLSRDWLTVNKSAQAAWGPIRDGIRQALAVATP